MRKASRHPTLSSMANSGCLLLSGSGMLPHSLQCPPAFLYLPEVRLMLASSTPALSPLPRSASLFVSPRAPRQHVTASRSLCAVTQSTFTRLTLDPQPAFEE